MNRTEATATSEMDTASTDQEGSPRSELTVRDIEVVTDPSTLDQERPSSPAADPTESQPSDEAEAANHEGDLEEPEPPRRRVVSLVALGILVAVLAIGIFGRFGRSSTNDSTASRLVGKDIADLDQVVAHRAIIDEPNADLRGAMLAPAYVREVTAPNWVVETDAVNGSTVFIFDVTGPGSEWGLRQNGSNQTWELYRRRRGEDHVVASTDIRADRRITVAWVGTIVRFAAGPTRLDVETGRVPARTTIGLASAQEEPTFQYFNLYIDNP